MSSIYVHVKVTSQSSACLMCRLYENRIATKGYEGVRSSIDRWTRWIDDNNSNDDISDYDSCNDNSNNNDNNNNSDNDVNKHHHNYIHHK